MWHEYMDRGGMWMFPLFGILFVLLVIYLFFGLGESKRRVCGLNPSSESAVDILNKRYARGEITREEFEMMKKDIPG
ncbi:MAG: putative rane protein [Synergistaceae bacterium]|jgi:putative membrane protein|nr:putative rane protein [Synergistaceae bacterium]